MQFWSVKIFQISQIENFIYHIRLNNIQSINLLANIFKE